MNLAELMEAANTPRGRELAARVNQLRHHVRHAERLVEQHRNTQPPPHLQGERLRNWRTRVNTGITQEYTDIQAMENHFQNHQQLPEILEGLRSEVAWVGSGGAPNFMNRNR